MSSVKFFGIRRTVTSTKSSGAMKEPAIFVRNGKITIYEIPISRTIRKIQ